MILVLALATVSRAADNPFVGTWKLNLTKSYYTQRVPKTETWKIEAQENGQKDIFDGVDAYGKAYHVVASPKYDGRDYPVTGNPALDTVSLKKIDAKTIESLTKKGGKEVERGRIVLSRDGKTITSTDKGKDSSGKDYTNITVYDKQ